MVDDELTEQEVTNIRKQVTRDQLAYKSYLLSTKEKLKFEKKFRPVREKFRK